MKNNKIYSSKTFANNPKTNKEMETFILLSIKK